MFLIKTRRPRALQLNEPLRHGAHKKPITRRDFLAQGFASGAATVLLPGLGGLLGAGSARAALSPDIEAMKAPNIRPDAVM